MLHLGQTYNYLSASQHYVFWLSLSVIAYHPFIRCCIWNIAFNNKSYNSFLSKRVATDESFMLQNTCPCKTVHVHFDILIVLVGNSFQNIWKKNSAWFHSFSITVAHVTYVGWIALRKSDLVKQKYFYNAQSFNCLISDI